VQDEGNVVVAATAPEQLWAVADGEGELHLVLGISALKDLIAQRGMTRTTAVYALSTNATTLGEIAGIRSAFEGGPDVAAAAKPTPEPEGAPAASTASVVAPAAEVGAADLPSQEIDEELSLLDRPFDDGDYFEDPPRRWLRPAAVAALVLALGAGGYRLIHSRSVSASPAAAREHEAPKVAVVEPPPVAPVAVVPAAVPAAPAPATPEPAPTAVAVEPAAPAAVEPAAQAPVAAPRAPSRSYPDLISDGQRQFQNGQTKRAQALFEQALAQTPEGTEALVGLAYVQLDRGRIPQAVALFQRALAQDRGDPTALFGLAESHRQGGDRGAALAEFQRFLRLRSTGSDAEFARQVVQELSSGG
jgi:Tfp pilus assembly protein PilF